MIKLKIDQSKYYLKKKEFVKVYKKLGLKWMEDTKWGDGWFLPDKMGDAGYVRKLPEEGIYKRFYAHNCQSMVDFLIGIGAEIISYDKVEEVVVKEPEHIKLAYEQIPEDFKITIGTNLDSSKMSDSFKKKWRELEIKYKDYTVKDFYKEIEEKNKRRRKEQGIEEDTHENDEVVIDKKSGDDVLPAKTLKKKAKAAKVKSIKTVKTEISPFKRKVFKITK